MRQGGYRMSSSQRRFRLLQESNSGVARMHNRRRLWLKVVVGLAVVVFAGAAFGALRNAKSLYTANVIVNYHKAAAETNHRKLMGSGNGGDASSPAVIIKSGISLDHVGDMVLDNPQHLLCDMHLYFVESAPDIEGLSVPLQRGKVMSVRKTPSFNECCNSCSAEKCHGFRYVGTECAHLEFPKVDLPELDFQKTMKQSYFTKQKAAALAERHHNAQLARLAKRDTEGAKLNLNAAEASDTQGPAPTDDTDSNQKDESLELLFEDSSAQGADEEVTDSSGNEENQQEEEDELDFSFDDSPGESENNSKPNVKQQSGEAALDFSVGSDESSAASADEASTMNASSVETSAPISEISMATAPASGDLGAKLLDGLKVDGAVGSIEALPAALQEIDHSDETEELREALGSKEAEATTSQLSDQELMDKLMDQVNNRHNQLNAAPEGGDEKKKKRDTTSEIQLDHDFNLELGRTRLKKIIPLGDYNRLTARDPVFDKHKTFWLRYRSNREMQSVAFDLARAHSNVKFTVFGKSGDRKKPQPLRSLRVGNGRRGKHIFVVASLRGCEWTGSLAVLHTAMILKGRGTTTKKLLDSVQFHFISLANPDGFDYSHQKSPSNARTWCKNRRVAVPGYHGVDLEHNWGLDGISWGFGKRDGAKLDNFQGPANFSEPETRHLRDYIKHYSTGRGRVAVLQIRCCAGSITPPQIYNPRSMNPINVVQVAEAMARQIETTDGSRYNVIQRETEFHSKNTGQMIDWAYNEANVDHAYVVDVKGSGLATRADHHKISIEPFQVLLRELEMAAAFTALKLLQMPIEGDAVNAPYKYKGSFGSSSDSSKSSDKSSKSSDKGSSNHSGKGSSKDHSKGKDHGKNKRKK